MELTDKIRFWSGTRGVPPAGKGEEALWLVEVLVTMARPKRLVSENHYEKEKVQAIKLITKVQKELKAASSFRHLCQSRWRGRSNKQQSSEHAG
jgi:hypothetical protein